MVLLQLLSRLRPTGCPGRVNTSGRLLQLRLEDEDEPLAR